MGAEVRVRVRAAMRAGVRVGSRAGPGGRSSTRLPHRRAAEARQHVTQVDARVVEVSQEVLPEAA